MKIYIISYHTHNAMDSGITKITRRDGEKLGSMILRAKNALDAMYGKDKAVIDAVNSLDAIVALDD